MKEIAYFLQKEDDIQSILKAVESGMSEQLVAGLSGSARSLLAAIVYESTKRPIILITHQLVQAEQLYEDLSELVEEQDVHIYPVNELVASELSIASPELRSSRIDALTAWFNKRTGILIAPVAALKRLLPPPSYWETYQLPFIYGEDIHLETYLESLLHMGYERTEMVTTPGDFSVRGGIVDIYPVTEAHPVRIELFDEEVDSIRYFDASSQRSLESLQEIVIGPASELLLTAEDLQRGADRLDVAFNETLNGLHKQEDKDRLADTFAYDLERLRAGERFPEIYKYACFFYEEPASLMDYLPKNGLIIVDELVRIQETAEHLDQEEAQWRDSLTELHQLVKNHYFSYSWEQVHAKWTQQRIYLSLFSRHISHTTVGNVVNLSARVMQEFHGQINLFKSELSRWKKSEFSVVILAPTAERQVKIYEILKDYDIEVAKGKELHLPVPTPTVVIGTLKNGIELPLQKLAIVTDQELFKTEQKRRRRPQKISNAERIKSYQELKIGDFVVHQNHGIGKYVGIETLEMKKIHKDYMVIEYSGDDRLFVPIEQVNLVQKFVGSEGKEPRLYKLGGTEWSKVKRRVQSTVEDIADDLIKLYAEREAQKGFAYSEDTDMQQAFEAAFPYQETDDQLRSIDEIKQDMEKERPMDRLLCGDVGYGKTEVAIRAAFKAIADGKQVAILVPTTILAQQHYETMIERFQGQAVEIGLLSRFRTRKQQTETMDRISRGLIDLVVGTHRLLSADIVYKDLGLLIVDEEQRFGVKHKERIKQLKTNVDVLTLTATPIPRTLHMSILGVRDLSILETPPENRFPVQTYVMEHNPVLVREAIEREMSRGGQVFYLFNRVERIEKIAQDISVLIPSARIAVAHGRMNETQLENVMLGFLEGEYDVLVSTTIIETGVDIPNVNTLIVHDADRMGLSQLYQLRGRVGRSNRVAYAYFTYQQDKVLTEVSEKRLQAIKEFTELGSGFKIAMRDLSIRGAGNLLGAQQHGFIDSVGFDMYSKMLKEAIDLRMAGGEVVAEVPFEPEISVQLDAYIPDEYIGDEKQKIDIYKQFQAIYKQADTENLQAELVDRFGTYPQELENLFTVTSMKRAARDAKVETINQQPRELVLKLTTEASHKIDGAQLFTLANGYGRNIRLGTDKDQLKISFTWQRPNTGPDFKLVIEFIDRLHEVELVDA